MNQKNVYLASKPRYAILDGLRGVAALVVILFHGFETYIPFFGTQHINHGYLAVDFFFVLSGFVIGYAYDDRWDRIVNVEFLQTPPYTFASNGGGRHIVRGMSVLLWRERLFLADRRH